MGVFYKKKNPSVLYTFLFVFGILAVIISVVGVLDYTETTGFCADTCHPMDEYGESYVDAEDDTILATHREEEVNCADCHNKPGVVGIVESKYAGVMEVVKFVTSQYPDPLHTPEVGEEFCAKSGCHDNTDWMIPGVGANLTIEEPTENDDGWIDHEQIEDYDMCNDCHAPHQDGIKLKPLGCTICHDVTEDQLEEHEDFVVGEDQFIEIVENVTKVETCADCHETMDKISYKPTTPAEFCDSCHTDEYVAYNENFTAEQVEFYGVCADCHGEHKDAEAPHPLLEDVECDVCHDPNYNGDEKTKIDIHDPSAISYTSVEVSLSNEFCSECHEGEFDAYRENSTPEQVILYGGCVDCHTDHKEEATKDIHPVIEDVDCSNCHQNYNDETTIHDTSGVSYASELSRVDNAFCSSCHSAEFSAYSENLTPGQAELYGEDCVDCHSDHDEKKEIHSTPDGLNCENCHTAGYEEISTHDPSQISYRSVGTQLEDDFCQNCHEPEYSAFADKKAGNALSQRIYGDCITCHGDHDEKSVPHTSDPQSETCVNCHTGYTEESSIHALPSANYGDMNIENEFCSSCHEGIYNGFSKGSIQDRSCVDCHSDHQVNIVAPNDNCSNCHSNFKNDHNP